MARHVVTVFGGSGFLGRHLVRRLARTGSIVRIAVRDPVAAEFLKTAGDVGQIVPIHAPVTEPDLVAAAVNDADEVFNLVGILYETGGATFRKIHVEGAQTVARAAAQAGATWLIHVSALGADADAPSVYAQTKAQAEAAVREAFPGATVIRPAVVFGPEDDFFNRFAGIMRLSPVLPVFGDGSVKMQPVYVGDVADAMMAIRADGRTAGRTYELGGPKVYTFKELMTLLLSVTGRQRLLLPLPFWAASFAATFLQLLPKPLLTRDQVTQLKRDNVVAAGASGLADLNIVPTAAEAILPTYLARFRLPSAPTRTLA
jgi:uncharacterized protein YbjT (DUF2867 family)